MICRSFKHSSKKHSDNFEPLPYQPENNDIPVQTPPTGFDALRTLAVSRKESQRDSVTQPRVARNELPWEIVPTNSSTLKGLHPRRAGI